MKKKKAIRVERKFSFNPHYLAIFFAVALFAVSIFFITIFAVSSFNMSKYNKVQATVVDTRHSDRNIENQKAIFLVYEYEFDGKIFRYTDDVSIDGRLWIGDKAIIYVNPNNPNDVETKGEAYFFLISGIAFVLVGGMLLVLGGILPLAFEKKRKKASVKVNSRNSDCSNWYKKNK